MAGKGTVEAKLVGVEMEQVVKAGVRPALVAEVEKAEVIVTVAVAAG